MITLPFACIALRSPFVTRDEAARLVRPARAGEPEAWADLVGGYQRLVLAIAFTFRLGRPDAEDVRQTVFFRLAQHLDRIRDPESIGSWIASVARNESLAVVRAARSNAGEDALASLSVEGPEAEVLASERSSELWQAFATLGDDCRTLLTLLLLEEPQPSYDEISIALDMPIGSIGPTRRRCLDRLKLALERT